MRKTVIFTVGVPGSGKSTYAEVLKPRYLRLERDRFREALFGSRIEYHKIHGEDREIRRSLSYVIGSAMYSAMNAVINEDGDYFDGVVISDTNIHWSSVQRFHRMARGTGCKIKVVVFDIPDEIVLERNQTRPEEHRVPEQVLKDFMDCFNGPKSCDHGWWRDSKLYEEIEFIKG